jgi:hypothetical protein
LNRITKRLGVALGATLACGFFCAPATLAIQFATVPATGCDVGIAPQGATPVGDWGTLQTDVSEVAGSTTFFLTGDITAPSNQSLSVPSGTSVTIDLDGCDLSITQPGSSDAAINVPSNSSLTIEDSSSTVTADQGTLTATATPKHLRRWWRRSDRWRWRLRRQR